LGNLVFESEVIFKNTYYMNNPNHINTERNMNLQVILKRQLKMPKV